MKKRITLLFGLSIVASLMFTSCEKDEETTPKEKKLYPINHTYYYEGELDGTTALEYDANKRLAKIIWGTGDYYSQYEYSNDGKLIKIIYYDNNEMYYYDSLEYNANNQVIKIYSYDFYNSKSKSIIQHSYSKFNSSFPKSSSLNKRVEKFSESILDGWRTLEYNNDGFVAKASGFSATGRLTGYNVNEYDANGNVINEKYYWLDDSNEFNTDEYDEIISEYDDKINSFKYLNGAYSDGSVVNNVIKRTWIEHYGENYTDIATYTIEYNDDNYPLKIKLDSEDSYETFEYTEL